MAEAVFISICIPAYSRVKYLNRLLDSVLRQSYRHFEVVITDDSPGADVHDLAHNHSLWPMIRYFKNEIPLGTPENWNECIRRAKGEWIKLMHDDDWFRDADSLLGFVGVMQKANADFYFSNYENVFPDGRTEQIKASAAFIRRLNRNPEILLAANRIGPPSTLIFRNDPLMAFDRRLRWLVDFDFYMHYLKAHPPAIHIRKSLICIGISDTQVTQTSFGNRNVEIPERFLLWEKMKPESIRNLMVYDSWWRFIRNLKIKRLQEINAAGYNGEIPLFVVSMIRWQRRIPQFFLDLGLSSKALMITHYCIGFIFSHSRN
ncbi:MAG: glycosyltransferase family 2 protein [Bacteroidota bacterium]|nr:glycosyltransferase family 2 protein [Bacteroidota bacterium]